MVLNFRWLPTMGVVFLVNLGGGSLPSDAAEMKTEYESLELDWGRMRVSFKGVGKSPQDAKTLKDAEQEAWNQGLLEARSRVIDFHANHYQGWQQLTPEQKAKAAEDAASQVSRSTYSRNTTYFADGSVRVDLESALPKALAIPGSSAKELPLSSECTGIILKSTKPMVPRGVYRLQTTDNQVVYDVSHVASKAFATNLMGRWFWAPSRREIERAVGSAPMEVEITSHHNADIRISSSAWRQISDVCQGALSQAKVMFSVPRG